MESGKRWKEGRKEGHGGGMKKQGKKNQNNTKSLKEHITLRREKFKHERTHLAPVLRIEISDIVKTMDNLCKEKRKNIRKRKRLQCTLFQKRKQLRNIENRVSEIEYEKKIIPYLSAYSNTNSSAYVRKPSRNLNVPGEKKNGPRRSQGVMGFVNTADNNMQQTVLKEYLAEMEGQASTTSIAEDDMCPNCDSAMVLDTIKSRLACSKCGCSTPHLDAVSSHMTYGDEIEFAMFSYKRSNHFNDWICQTQGKESTEVSLEVIEKVMDVLYIRGFRKANKITTPLVRSILKTLKLRRAYEHVAQITARVSGIPPPRMTPELEEQCRLMFLAVQEPFERFRPKHRKNFLSYSYVLFKFFELLGCDEFIKRGSFALLKGKDKLEKQDQIFQKICGSLDWEFIPSV